MTWAVLMREALTVFGERDAAMMQVPIASRAALSEVGT
jgi:hypothetical protein